MSVEAAGQSEQYAFDCTGCTNEAMGWITRTWDFTANGNTTTLEFYSLDTDNGYYGPALDNVIITAVPEPATLLLIDLGGLVVRRRK